MISDAIDALSEIEKALQRPSLPGQKEIALQAVNTLRRLFYGLALCADCVEKCRGQWRKQK